MTMNNKYHIFNDLQRVQKRNRNLVIASLFVVVITVVTSLVVVSKAHETARANAYLIYGSLRTPLSPITNSRRQLQLLTEGHIKQFHQLFFSLEPDLDFIKRNIEEKALFMVDDSGKRLYVRLVEKKYFHDVVVMDYRYITELDSIRLDFSKYPIPFIYYGKQEIEKGNSKTYRKLITTGKIKEAGITENNLNGMKIFDFEVLDNSDLVQ